MTVSVIVPAWNAAATLAETLASLVAQTRPQWEAVVVDDASEDATAAIAGHWAARDGRIRLVGQAHGGEAAARNRGLAEARGEWLLFLDADDWIDPRHLETMLAALVAAPEADAVHCGYARVTADGEVLQEPYRAPEGDLFPTLARRAAFAVHACVVRKVLVDQVGGFDASFKTSPDWDLWQRVARAGARFAAVPEVLAYYRMRPGSASRDARQLFRDGLRVIENGHRADPRVPRPLPQHAEGLPDPPETQAFYLMAWCAGLMLGSDQDPAPLFDAATTYRFPELYPPAVAQCLFDAIPQATCEGPASWPRRYAPLVPAVERFLAQIEGASGAVGLASSAAATLRRLVLEHSSVWPLVTAVMQERIDELAARHARDLRDMEEHHGRALGEHEEWRRWAEARHLEHDDRRRSAESRQAEVERERDRLVDELAAVRAERDRWSQMAATRDAQLDDVRRALGDRTGERDAAIRSSEYGLGDAILNRWRLRGLVEAAHGLSATGSRLATLARLRLERRLPRQQPLRVAATACDVFPIYSQTFVYQELTSLASVAQVRFIYSKLDHPDRLAPSFRGLWSARRRLALHRPSHERDFAHYRTRRPGAVESILSRLSAASGLSVEALQTHDNVLQAFSYTRMVEAYRPDYLHSYFFYDRSLMSLIAAELLDLPRGVSCYADHRLKDYELKVVPLHLETCDIVIATSRRIGDELLAIAPEMDPARILVKPNGIDTTRFAAPPRELPAGDTVVRLVTVCRIEPKKGLLDLVEAVALLRSRGVRVEAHIVGEADEWSAASRDYKRALDARISEHGLWGTVHLEGRQSQDGVRRLLELGHVFVAPFVATESGDSDGIPTALLEGMAAGLPVVATDAGSIAEVIEPGREGLVVAQRDPVALADAIEEIVTQPTRSAAMAAQSRATVRARFDATEGERVFHARLEEVVAARRRRQ